MRPSVLAPSFVLVLFASPARAQTADPADLVAAEEAFARDVAEAGLRDGFLAHLAPDAIVFQPGPVDAVPFYEARERRPGLLEWAPSFAEIADEGDLGWTTGPWTFRSSAGEAPVAGGHYVSVWRRGEDGTRRVALDVGVSHAIPELEAVEAGTSTVAPSAAGDEDMVAESLMAADRALVEAAAEDLREAFEARGAPDLRVYRNGSPPAVGRDAAVEAALAFGPLGWTPAASRVSEGGTLGYVYGGARTPAGGEAGYLRIWRRGADGAWTLALDLATAEPPSGS